MAQLSTILFINKHEDVVGEFDTGSAGSYTETGYLLSKGVFTVIVVPGALDTIAYSINDAGAIVGTYLASDDSTHGFLYQSGTYTTIDYPGSFSQNELSGINNSGMIVGAYGDGVQFGHAFIYQSGQDRGRGGLIGLEESCPSAKPLVQSIHATSLFTDRGCCRTRRSKASDAF
jgi:probable HAF family extracellular repeat protein